MITEPGGYTDVSEESYHADCCPEPSLSSSIVKKLTELSPLHAWHAHPRLNPNHESKNSTTFDLGKAAHKLLLGKGAEIVVIDAANYQANAAKAERAQAWKDGKIPLLTKEMEQAEGCAKAVRAQLRHHKDASDAFTGEVEATLIWQEDNGVWCRARPDGMPRTMQDGVYLDDFKSTKAVARAETFGRRGFWDLSYDIQDAWYRRAVRKVYGVHANFRFIVAENQPPYGMVVLEMDELGRERAEESIELAIETWGRCLRTMRWPGYSDRTEYVSPPVGREYRMADLRASNRQALQNFDEIMALQAP